LPTAQRRTAESCRHLTSTKSFRLPVPSLVNTLSGLS
jgi:hypothetical protein